MKVILRTDASIQIGTGHVMRCLTLADALAAQGHQCHFICRAHRGHLGELIVRKGHGLTLLSSPESSAQQLSEGTVDDYASWLGVPWPVDAEETMQAIAGTKPDWLVVDHYALDARWEQQLTDAADKIMVIDDLANRTHRCVLLLDQTFGRQPEDYRELVPENATLLCGSKYALLRPEFAQLRGYSLRRRQQGRLQHLLVNLGGVDKDNTISQILQALAASRLPKDCRITVVMGATAPWTEEVKQKAAQLPWPTEVKVGVENMAKLMADSDLAIGAAGSTSWERCCLGLPAIMVVLAENQARIASALETVGAVHLLNLSSLDTDLVAVIDSLDAEAILKLSSAARDITDGSGVMRTIEKMLNELQN